MRERQRRHRLLESTRPRERPHRDNDPLELAKECPDNLKAVRQAAKSNVVARDHLREAEEVVMRLAWGIHRSKRQSRRAALLKWRLKGVRLGPGEFPEEFN
jgi:hypothetical protein